MQRCGWGTKNKMMIDYHDKEWGVPVHDDRLLFEFLSLEGAQAGLSWETILNRRIAYRKAFDNFDFEKITRYNQTKIDSLIQNPEIIRNKLKIYSVITNAQKLLEVRTEFGSFDKYIWSFVDHSPIKNQRKNVSDIPTKTNRAESISKDLKKRGFKFIGPTICYAFMQAAGLVNDHQVGCFRYTEINKLSSDN